MTGNDELMIHGQHSFGSKKRPLVVWMLTTSGPCITFHWVHRLRQQTITQDATYDMQLKRRAANGRFWRVKCENPTRKQGFIMWGNVGPMHSSQGWRCGILLSILYE